MRRPPGGFVEPYLILRDQHLDPVVDYHKAGDAPLLPPAGFFIPNRDNLLIHTGHAGSQQGFGAIGRVNRIPFPELFIRQIPVQRSCVPVVEMVIVFHCFHPPYLHT